ncbi:Rod shape-determining protein MreD [uncultured Candidatus Thioglobus sp.]|nr:Rod shape-determining protein MreD [uncultured Candidatus Thioglobus sp.]SMN01070.1 Rod shape-determining protein MreD [uncultured Candidatus Thioglobus sp.]
MNTRKPYVYFTKTALLTLIISTLPLPLIALEVSPFWILLLFVYWITRFTVYGVFFLALFLGLLIDILYGDVLGKNALALILSSAFIVNVKQSFSVSNLSTQQVYVFIASIIYLAILLLVHSLLIQELRFSYYLLLAPLSSALIWPIVRFLLEKIKY